MNQLPPKPKLIKCGPPPFPKRPMLPDFLEGDICVACMKHFADRWWHRLWEGHWPLPARDNYKLWAYRSKREYEEARE